MTTLKAKSYPTNLGKPPTSRSSFTADANTNRIIWVNNASTATKGSFTPGYGVTARLESEGSPYGAGGMQEANGLMQDNGTKGFRVRISNGTSHYGNIEIKISGDARWMPAAIFNGCGFEVHQNSDSKHAMWVDRYALGWKSATSSTIRWVGNTANDGHNDAPYSGYRYFDFNYQSYIDEIRGFGTDWLFHGIVLHIKNNGGAGSTDSTVKCWNLKMYHRCVGSTSSDHRIFAPKLRPEQYRNSAYFGVTMS